MIQNMNCNFFNLLSRKFYSIFYSETRRNLEHDRTRTCNHQIRGLVPYPLGHMVVDERK